MGKFERIKYPDGQISAKWIATILSDPIVPDYTIKERINSYEDLFYIRSIADCPPAKGLKLFIPCMFGQRSDRRFDRFQSFDLKLIADIINECNFREVQIFDPHSDVTMALINNSVKISSFEYVERAVKDIMTNKQLLEDGYLTNLILIAPDAGAYKKVFDYGEKLSLPVIGALKHRDKNGKVDLTFSSDVTGKDCLIVDDLCDGGYTFLVLADELRKHGARKVYLYVSHGLFSKGFTALAEQIDHIYCTNSINDIETREIGRETGLTNFVTQYKII